MKTVFIMDMIQPDGTFSIKVQSVEVGDFGEKIISIDRLNVFEPGQFNRLVDLPEELQRQIKEIWTPQIIEKWASSCQDTAELQ